MLLPRLIWRLAAVPVAAAAALALAGAAFCSATLHVSKAKVEPRADAETVRIEAHDGVPLVAWWFQPTRAIHGCVAVLHGIADSRNGSAGFARMFLDRGFAVLTPDSRGHGESGGGLVTYGLLERHDVHLWVEWMRHQGCAKVYGLGESLGASILIQAAGEFNAIVAECPFADLREIATYRMGQMVPVPVLPGVAVFSGMLYARARLDLDVEQVSPLKSIGETQTPILLIHGLNDTRTPPEHSKRLAAASKRSDLWLVPGAGHVEASAAAPEEFWRRVLDWFGPQ